MQCPTHVKKLDKLEEMEEKKTCAICGREASYGCKSCTYVQCSNCQVCSAKHSLIKIVRLSVTFTLFILLRVSIIIMNLPVILAQRVIKLMIMGYGIVIPAIMTCAWNVLNDYTIIIRYSIIM